MNIADDLGDRLRERDLQLPPHNGEEPGCEGRLPGRADGMENTIYNVDSTSAKHWFIKMGLILKCQEILPKMRAVLVDWMVCKCIGCVTKCNYLSIVLLGGRPPPVPHAAGDPFQHCRHSGQVLKDRQLSSLATERKLWQNVSSVGSELSLAGICRKRSPASAARNFSWWGSPVCSVRPSKPDHLKIVKRFC